MGDRTSRAVVRFHPVLRKSQAPGPTRPHPGRRPCAPGPAPSIHPVLRAALAATALAVVCAFARAPIATAEPTFPTDAASCSGTDLEACYRWDQMSELAATGEEMVTGYLTQLGISRDSQPRLIFIPSGLTEVSQCIDVEGDTTQNDRSYDFCPTDNAVYIGQNNLWDSYRRYGSVGPISGIAHEFGHFLQSVMLVPNPGSADETIRHENQADCFSGAFIGFLRASPKDLDAVERYLTATASFEAPGRDHGTAGERIDSFRQGYNGGLPACSRFYPATPLDG